MTVMAESDRRCDQIQLCWQHSLVVELVTQPEADQLPTVQQRCCLGGDLRPPSLPIGAKSQHTQWRGAARRIVAAPSAARRSCSCPQDTTAWLRWITLEVPHRAQSMSFVDRDDRRNVGCAEGKGAEGTGCSQIVVKERKVVREAGPNRMARLTASHQQARRIDGARKHRCQGGSLQVPVHRRHSVALGDRPRGYASQSHCASEGVALENRYIPQNGPPPGLNTVMQAAYIPSRVNDGGEGGVARVLAIRWQQTKALSGPSRSPR
jgi:hypothetical protein